MRRFRRINATPYYLLDQVYCPIQIFVANRIDPLVLFAFCDFGAQNYRWSANNK